MKQKGQKDEIENFFLKNKLLCGKAVRVLKLSGCLSGEIFYPMKKQFASP